MTIVTNVLTWLQNQLISILHSVLSVFPHSPFSSYIDSLSKSSILDYLAYINWFIPFSFILDVMLVWLTAVSAFYLYSVVARWIKLI
jgi:hypothetical protein